MAHTNRGRVILGGLLAGVVINVVEFITHGLILRESWGRALQALGKPEAFSAGAIVVFNIWGFLLGIAAVWLYAAIRTRYGPGPITAVRAGLVAWGLAALLPNLAGLPMGLFPAGLILTATIVSLIEVVVATLAGAWLYREEPASAIRAVAA